MANPYIPIILIGLISLVVLVLTVKLKKAFRNFRIFPETIEYHEHRIILAFVFVIATLVLAPTIYFFTIMKVAWIFFVLTAIMVPIFLIAYHYQGRVNKELHALIGSGHILILSFMVLMLFFSFVSAFTDFSNFTSSPIFVILSEIISYPTIFVGLIVIGAVSIIGALLSPPKPKHEY